MWGGAGLTSGREDGSQGRGGLAAGGVEPGMARHHRVRMAQGDEDCNVLRTIWAWGEPSRDRLSKDLMIL